MRFYKNGELKDEEIIKTLEQAILDYKNGELIETRDVLVEIVRAIDAFDKNHKLDE